MGRYGIDYSIGKTYSEDEMNTIKIETTKIIEANQIETKEDRINLAFAFYDRGRVYGEQCEYDKAISDYTSAIQIYQRFANAYYNRGLCYWELNQHDKALNDLNKSLVYYQDYENTKEEQIQKTNATIERLKQSMQANSHSVQD
jgi:tetratricopeptide (TPR) repeat protein